MSQNDIYCPVCGAAFSIPLFKASGSRDESSAGHDRPTDEDMRWLKDIRILYQGTYRQLPRRVHLSSLVVTDRNGQYRATGNLPPDDFDNAEPDIFGVYKVYGAPENYEMPLHDACSKLLVKFLDYAVGIDRSIYLEVLYKSLRTFQLEPYKVNRGGIKFGRIAKQHGQFWYPTLDTKAFVYDPFFITPALKNYYDNLPVVEPCRAETSECKACCIDAVSSRDPSATLPAELLMMILIHLPAKSIAALSLASVVIARAQLPGGFWRQKLQHDMPWLWDFPYHRTERVPRSLDWLQIYKDIYVGSKSYDKSPFLNLANRRRVWRICEQIAPRFAEYQESRDFSEERDIRELLWQPWNES